MKVGLCLPVFRPDARGALDVARQAEDEGLDGVFCFDHLFPIGRPDRPSLSAMPLLGALARATRRVSLGPLVTRVGLMPAPFLTASLTTINDQSGGRLIAGLGAGDRLSRPEHRAYGLAFPPVADRVEAVAELADTLTARRVRTWVGGRSAATRQIAIDHADGWNCWEGDASDFEGFPAGDKELSWGGLPPPQLDDHLGELKELGVAWVVYGPAPSIDWPAFVTKLAGAARAVQ